MHKANALLARLSASFISKFRDSYFSMKSTRTMKAAVDTLYVTDTRSIMTRMQISEPKGNPFGCGLRNSVELVSFNQYTYIRICTRAFRFVAY